MTPDRFPQGPDFDYIRPAERVPREPSDAPPSVDLLLGLFLIFLGMAIWAAPDLAAWISTWSVCR